MNFDNVIRLMDESVEKHCVPCSEIIVTRKGEEIFRYRNGTRDVLRKEPLTGKELYFLYSATKPITCTAALQLVEQGKLGLEDKLADYLPEFAEMYVKQPDGSLKKAQNPITIRNLFTMTTGFHYNVACPSIMKVKEENPDAATREVVCALAHEPLSFEPGTHYQYSLSHDVLAAVIEVVSGETFGEYLKKHIFDVCGMTRTGFIYSQDALEDMCTQYAYNEAKQEAELRDKSNYLVMTANYESGGAGLVSCVDDYIKFATAMVTGEKLLKKETFALMRQNHLGEQPLMDFQNVKRGYAYGLGVRTDVNAKFVARGECGWDGAAGSYVLMDPENQIAIYYATHILAHGVYLYETLHPALRDEIYRQIMI